MFTNLALTMLLLLIIAAVGVYYLSKTNPISPYSSPSSSKQKRKNGEIPGFIDDAPTIAWLAIKTSNKFKVADFLGFSKVWPKDWETANDVLWRLSKVLSDTQEKAQFFITPNIDGWILVAGWDDSFQSIGMVEISQHFDECQYFSVSSYGYFSTPVPPIEWILMRRGEKIRSFFFDIATFNLEESGTITAIEKLILATNYAKKLAPNSFDETAEPTIEDLSQIAANWSVNPFALERRSNIDTMGLLCEY